MPWPDSISKQYYPMYVCLGKNQSQNNTTLFMPWQDTISKQYCPMYALGGNQSLCMPWQEPISMYALARINLKTILPNVCVPWPDSISRVFPDKSDEARFFTRKKQF
jgi:hypothetical protein